MNAEENDKKTNAKDDLVKNSYRKDSTEVDNESEIDQNDAKEVHTDDSDEKTENTAQLSLEES